MSVLEIRFVRRQIAAALVIGVGLSFAPAATSQQQAYPASQGSSSSQPTQPVQAQSGQLDASATLPESPTPAQNRSQSGESEDAQSNPDAQQSGGARPLGTAAAPVEKVTGVPASRPAGAAIAPGKQHRVRSFLIKTGLIVGAGVAVGTVVALSRSSSGRP